MRQLDAPIPFDINAIKAFPYEYEPEQQAARLLVELPDLAARLDGGALVVLEPGRRRVRTLPL